MIRHTLKTWPQYFQAVERGDKTFEIRQNDRGFEVGDELELIEFDPREGAGLTGRAIDCTVTYITTFEQRSGWVVMGIRINGH